MGHANPKPFATPAAPMAPGHVGGGSGLVNEDQPLRIEVELILKPLFALGQDVGPVLLAGVRRLFLRVMA